MPKNWTIPLSTCCAAASLFVAAISPAAATPAATMSLAPAARPIVKVDFLGGPFFGRHGYYFPAAKRRYFYSDYYPRARPLRRRHRWSRYCRRHPAACRP